MIACCGDKRRDLKTELPEGFSLPKGFGKVGFVQAGVLAIQSPGFVDEKGYQTARTLCTWLERFSEYLGQHVPLIIMVDDADFATANLNNFLWVTFTRTNPSHDIHGVHPFYENKHWGCKSALVFDARKKPHHAPELQSDENVSKKAKSILKDLLK